MFFSFLLPLMVHIQLVCAERDWLYFTGWFKASHWNLICVCNLHPKQWYECVCSHCGGEEKAVRVGLIISVWPFSIPRKDGLLLEFAFHSWVKRHEKAVNFVCHFLADEDASHISDLQSGYTCSMWYSKTKTCHASIHGRFHKPWPWLFSPPWPCWAKCWATYHLNISCAFVMLLGSFCPAFSLSGLQRLFKSTRLQEPVSSNSSALESRKSITAMLKLDHSAIFKKNIVSKHCLSMWWPVLHIAKAWIVPSLLQMKLSVLSTGHNEIKRRALA